MNRLQVIVTLFMLLGAAPYGAAQGERTNIIAVVTDDQARWALGAYGNKECRTPNMDRLAREGGVFLNAFTATPVCSPSRATYLTGLYGTQVGITDYLSPDEMAAGLGLPAAAATWPAVLQKHGYRTGLIGKWHLGSQAEFHPSRRGFHHFTGFLGGGSTPLNPTLEVNGKTEKMTGSLPDLLVDDAIRFVESNRDRPFALLVHFRAPHAPYGPVPEQDSAPFKDLDPSVPKAAGLDPAHVKRLTRDYYASIHSVDRNLGRLLTKLDELKLSGKTIVTFTSDHGYMIGHHGLWHKGNGASIAGGVAGPMRPNMFDDSIRVPLLVRWPGVVKPGTSIAEPVANVDMYASVLGMLGIPVPEGSKQQGLDFSPLLRGDKPRKWREAIVAQYDLHNFGLAYMRMIRTEQWKLVRFHRANGLDELYDLQNDPGETRNLNRDPKHQKVRDELQGRLTEWMKAIDDPLLRAR
jgi:uncharacterized sulfatase